MAYIFEDHTADIMLVVKSNNLLDFFNDILSALWEIFLLKNEECRAEKKKSQMEPLELKIHFENDDELVFNFINRYVYLAEVNKKIIKFVKEIRMFENLTIFYTEAIKVERIVSYIKSPTYHNFEVDLNKYFCRVIIDV